MIESIISAGYFSFVLIQIIGQCFKFDCIEIILQVEAFEIDDRFRKTVRLRTNLRFPLLRRFSDKIESVTEFSYGSSISRKSPLWPFFVCWSITLNFTFIPLSLKDRIFSLSCPMTV